MWVSNFLKFLTIKAIKLNQTSYIVWIKIMFKYYFDEALSLSLQIIFSFLCKFCLHLRDCQNMSEKCFVLCSIPNSSWTLIINYVYICKQSLSLFFQFALTRVLHSFCLTLWISSLRKLCATFIILFDTSWFRHVTTNLV